MDGILIPIDFALEGETRSRDAFSGSVMVGLSNYLAFTLTCSGERSSISVRSSVRQSVKILARHTYICNTKS